MFDRFVNRSTLCCKHKEINTLITRDLEQFKSVCHHHHLCVVNKYLKYLLFQERVYEEIVKVVEGREIVSDDISKLQYIHMVIRESLRMFPPIPLIARTVTEETQLGTSFYVLFHCPKL